jgi:hypothetical protein
VFWSLAFSATQHQNNLTILQLLFDIGQHIVPLLFLTGELLLLPHEYPSSTSSSSSASSSSSTGCCEVIAPLFSILIFICLYLCYFIICYFQNDHRFFYGFEHRLPTEMIWLTPVGLVLCSFVAYFFIKWIHSLYWKPSGGSSTTIAASNTA